jgi:hypothetical protein
VIDGGDGHHEGERRREVCDPPPPCGEPSAERSVNDEAGQHCQQNGIDCAVDATAPDQFEEEVRAIRAGSGVLTEDVADQRDTEYQAEQAAQLPVARQSRPEVEPGAPRVRREQRQNRREVDGEVHVVLQLEDARPYVGNREAHDGCGAEPGQLTAPAIGMRLAAGRDEMQAVQATRSHGVNLRPARVAAIGTKP